MPRPLPPGEVSIAHARRNAPHRPLGTELHILLSSPEFQYAATPFLEEVDGDRAKAREHAGDRPKFSAWQLEGMLIFRILSKAATIQQGLTLLSSDVHTDAMRELEVFYPHEMRSDRRHGRVFGVPVKSTLYRYLDWIGTDRRLSLWRAIHGSLTNALLDIPEIFDRALLLFGDSSLMNVRATAPIISTRGKTKGQIVNQERITAPDAGYLGRSRGRRQTGSGYKATFLTTEDHVILNLVVNKNTASDKDELLRLLADYRRTHLQRFAEHFRVLVADSAFAAADVREECRRMGILECIHWASHKLDSQRAEHLDGVRLAIHGRPGWYLNGHRELFCDCGTFHRHTEPLRWRRDGSISTCVVGRCPVHGVLRLTSGGWRSSKNPPKIVPSYGDADADLRIGNPLTFHSPIAELYGNARHSQQESVFGVLRTRFELLRDGHLYKSAKQAEIDLLIAASILHAIQLHTLRQRGAVRIP